MKRVEPASATETRPTAEVVAIYPSAAPAPAQPVKPRRPRGRPRKAEGQHYRRVELYLAPDVADALAAAGGARVAAQWVEERLARK